MNMILKISYSEMQKLILGGHGTPYCIDFTFRYFGGIHLVHTQREGVGRGYDRCVHLRSGGGGG